ncbi:hypothetical protein CBW65_01405 [Tumebacillus avium]|uniref:Methyltransferase type 11 domain-containing protein n=1 Tax=Tumebacillus avium TaxID=1903704 RepID=A0A1Y0IIG2_9BACL|nr:class I SAM-dependent methyltransferase [Tumebacillus avium]ARU59859.1 hypothetical protein CBW65_01405 [Tumebacillus avium]
MTATTKTEMLTINKTGWNTVASQFFEGRKETLSYGPYAPTEEELNLLGDLQGARILEIGCGSGHTLEYLARHGAEELWGVDLSGAQIESAREVLKDLTVPVTLLEAPMEDIPGLPEAYFDKVVSLYALGWTVDLQKTVQGICRSLKKGGQFVFSWEHPVHTTLDCSEQKFVMNRRYTQEGPSLQDSWRGVPIVMHRRKLSTFVNELIRAGFVLDQIIEETRVGDHDISQPEQWYSAARANIVPSTFIICCHKS